MECACVSMLSSILVYKMFMIELGDKRSISPIFIMFKFILARNPLRIASGWVPNAKKNGINNMKYTWPEFCVGDRTQNLYSTELC